MVNLGKIRHFENVSLSGYHFRNFRRLAGDEMEVSFEGAGDITDNIDQFELQGSRLKLALTALYPICAKIIAVI